MNSFKQAYKDYLHENNKVGSGKASSYLKSLEWLKSMLDVEPYGFSDCKDIWSIHDVSRIYNLKAHVLREKQKKSQSLWVNDDIPVSYLRDDFCSSALAELIEFIPQYLHTQQVIKVIKQHNGDESELAKKLNFEPTIPEDYVHDPKSQDGKDRIAAAKVRIGQRAFRKIILGHYNNRCCVTGLDIPTVNRASHIIGWADPKGKNIRMDLRNGLCLSATYDAAFDRHLISLDPDYRIILSKEIKDHYSSKSVQTYFRSIEGVRIELPNSYHPNQDYLKVHRDKGVF